MWSVILKLLYCPVLVLCAVLGLVPWWFVVAMIVYYIADLDS